MPRVKPHLTPYAMKHQGFTLVELLVVLSIIALLVAASVGAASSALESAHSARSVSNLRQWSAAMLTYAADNDGTIPRRGQGVQQLTVINRPEDWFNCLPPYMGSGMDSYQDLIAAGHRPKAGENSIFVDPGAKDPGGTYFLSYAMNMYLSPWIRPQPHHLLEISDLTLVVFMAESPGPYSSTIPSSQGYSVSARYHKKANVAFLDGHVEAFSAQYLGCGTGEIEHDDIHWVTGTDGVNQGPVP